MFDIIEARVICCWLSWLLTLVMQSRGRKVTHIIFLAKRNLKCYNNVVKVTNAE
jgi:hypothetical protein